MRRTLSAAAVVATLAVLAGCGGSEQGAVGPVPAQLRNAFAVLSSPRETMPPDLRRIVEDSLDAPGLRFEHAQFIKTDVGEVWLVPADEELCIIHSGTLHGYCEKTAKAVRAGITFPIKTEQGKRLGKPTFVIVGAQPDGVRAVKFTTGRVTRNYPVRENTYGLVGKTPISMEAIRGRARARS